jgi:hypothetical protein
MNTIPCKECITLPICLSKRNQSLGVYNDIYHYITRCSLLKDYLTDKNSFTNGLSPNKLRAAADFFFMIKYGKS